MDENSFKLLCNACLCVGQTLNIITDATLKRFYLDALNEIPLCNIADITPMLCWDCEALLRRAITFKDQVKESYQVLLTYTSENLQDVLITDICRTPRLTVKTNKIIAFDPDEESVEPKPVLVKEESLDWECDRVSPLPTSPGIHEVKSLPETPALKNVIPDTQQVYIKDVLTNDNHKDGDFTGSDDDPEYEPKILRIDKTDAKRKRKTKKGLKEKRTKKEKKIKKKKETDVQNLKIISIDLSYEDVMLERDREKKKDFYLKSKYKCESCIIGYNYYKSYKTHLTVKHSESIGEYSCPVCKTVYATVDSFTVHYKRHMKRYECSICQKRTVDLKVMQQHYYSTHEIALREYKCNVCGQISNSVDTHRYHRESHKGRLQCTECDKTFRHRAGLLNHRIAVHEYKSKFPCDVCNKVFKWRNSLRRHQEAHGNKNSVAAAAYCALCGVSFSSLSSYQRHLKISLKHITKDQLRFICDHCDIKFADKTKLRDHIEEKHLHKTFQCHICQKASKNRVGLDQHIRNVHKGRPNNKMCHHCGKGFPTKVQLDSHIRTHTGERPFICEYCPTTFSQQSNLYKHNRQVHLNVKSKRYPTCKKRGENGPPPAAPMIPPPAVSVSLLHYPETGYMTDEL